ncbi:sugar phosphate isomerase/epimerase family protein [Sinorhizobium meliloti]|uniref:sugar phosphate isomerase/epimerase family protein n=1 Tax=Rhizobium meliloti TaxID=382 RepID=UPI00028619D0|nr:sugar phosphate isomerase/epimerase family protein [Sinorhizobium meliloti]ASP83111.1 sugar phosphate isomerase/epimerase [Sinorhizobium meliloti]MQW20085.1 TIM barrel protein [Sinorhizobium meliloti]CCM69632.1 unnamed protein product [Sinorhizobium meliloti Rm41]
MAESNRLSQGEAEPGLYRPRLGACTWAYLWRQGIVDTLRTFDRLGLRTIDIITVPPHPFPSAMSAEERSALARSAAELQVSIETLNVPSTDVNLCSVNEDTRRFTIDQLTSIIALASDLSAPMITCVPGRRLNFNAPSIEQSLGWLSGCLDELIPVAERAGVKILFELHPMSCLPNTSSLCGFLDRYGSPKLGLALDVTNAVFVGEDPVQSILASGPHLRQLHLSDARTGQWAHDVVGSGDLDFGSIFDALKTISFRGTSIIEITCDDPDTGFAASRRLLSEAGWQA